MPLWKIYHPPGAFSREQKAELSAAITKLYARLPKFYVGIVFQAVEAEDFWVGGEPHGNFVRIWIDHIARQFPTPEARTRAVNYFIQALKPHIGDRGFDWEFHIDETPFDLWAIQGLRPPKPESEAENRWIAENRPSAYEPA